MCFCSVYFIDESVISCALLTLFSVQSIFDEDTFCWQFSKSSSDSFVQTRAEIDGCKVKKKQLQTGKLFSREVRKKMLHL